MKSFEVTIKLDYLKTGKLQYQATIEPEVGEKYAILFGADGVIAQNLNITLEDLEAVLSNIKDYLDQVKMENIK